MAKKRPANNKGIILVKKANQLIESRYKFDIWETRFFLSVLGQVRREDDEFRVYRVWYRDVIKTFGLKSGDSYSFLRAAANSLMEKSFFVSYELEGAGREIRYHILRKIDYLKEGESGGAGESQEYVDVTVEHEMKPLLLQLQKNFTAYDLRNVVKLGVYPMRIYELLKQYESIGERTLSVDEVKKMFEIGVEYARFPDFNRWVIKPAIRDINKHTDLEITLVEYRKESRRVVGMRFVFRRKVREEVAEQPSPKAAAEPNSTFSNQEKTAAAAPKNTDENPLHQFSAKLFDWWGVQTAAFLQRAAGKSVRDVQTAIEFTKTRIQMGKAENPAGVFLEALTKGHVTPDQHKAQKKVTQEQKALELKAKIQPLAEEYAQLQDAKSRFINDVIREITHEKPMVTETVIERIKNNFRNMGVVDFADKSLEDFRQSPMLRALVKAEIMKDFADRFAESGEFQAKIDGVKKEILDLDAGFRFE